MRAAPFIIVILLAGCLPTRSSTPLRSGHGANDMGTRDTSSSDVTINNVVEDMAVSDTAASDDVAVAPDMSMPADLGTPDMGPPCIPEDDATFCSRQGALCGNLTSADNCGTMRTAFCGGCNGVGIGCSQAHVCGEGNCRDQFDNDGNEGVDCADPDCLGQRCDSDPNRACQANGDCS